MRIICMARSICPGKRTCQPVRRTHPVKTTARNGDATACGQQQKDCRSIMTHKGMRDDAHTRASCRAHSPRTSPKMDRCTNSFSFLLAVCSPPGRRTFFATSLFCEVRFLCYLLLKLLADRYFQLVRVRLGAQGRI